MKTVFLRILPAADKAEALRVAARQRSGEGTGTRFEVDTAKFSAVPRSPFAYWVSERLRCLFSENKAFGAVCSAAVNGTGTLNDFRFVRAWFEDDSSTGHMPFAKGGSTQSFYADIPTTIRWANDAAELKAFVVEVYGGGSWSRSIRNTEYYGLAGMTWPLRAARFSPTPLPRGCVFSVRSYAAFPGDEWLDAAVGLCSSLSFDALFKTLLGRFQHPEFVCGSLLQVPIPGMTPSDRDMLSTSFRRAWSLKRSLDTRTETSHAFILPAVLQVLGDTLAARATVWAERVCVVEAELATIQAGIDARCFELYGVDEADRHAITEGFGAHIDESGVDVEPEPDDEGEGDAVEAALADTTSLTAEFLAWAVGAAFGRFDLRLATDERAAPPEPDPFDPLPVCSAGMLTGDDGLPLAEAPPGYPLAFPADGVLVDDPGHPRDLAAAVRSVFDIVFGADANARWQEAAELLDSKGLDLRDWLARSFFEHHLKRHSKSRRKAPILWQLATPSGGYSIWLYAHRLTKDTLFHLQNDIVAPKLAHEERKHSSLVQEAGPNPTASHRKALAALESSIDELRAFRDEVARVAPLWNPDLNDGVLLTSAPLWRLFPQHRAWQKELKAAWESVSVGKYDWAHLAMHLWPERVVPKCATDRSLAIAHGLEEEFWVEGPTGKWQQRAKPLPPVDELIRQRSSTAAKAALGRLGEAPASRVARTRRGRKGTSA